MCEWGVLHFAPPNAV